MIWFYMILKLIKKLSNSQFLRINNQSLRIVYVKNYVEFVNFLRLVINLGSWERRKDKEGKK